MTLHTLVGAPKSATEERCAVATHHAKATRFWPAPSSGGEASPNTTVQGDEEDAKAGKKRHKLRRQEATVDDGGGINE
jgi:hypothetical protein